MKGVQADVFDHVLAIIPEFDLQVFSLRPAEISSGYCLLLPKKKELDSDHQKGLYLLYFS